MAYALLSPTVGVPDPFDEAVPTLGTSHPTKLGSAAATLEVLEHLRSPRGSSGSSVIRTTSSMTLMQSFLVGSVPSS